MTDETAQAALDRAIDEHEQLLLVYQPIHDADSGAIYGAEALLRQRRRSGEIREASVITETAEENGGPELYRLDSMVVKQAYSDAARWPGGVRLNVNLSPREFEDGNVLERLEGLVTSCGVDPQKVNLEITETSYIKHPRETMKVLEALRERGVSLWLDDFGTGHSSIAHLQHFPLDGLKIPGAFVKELPGEPRSRAIAKALVALAHDLDLEVIAEEVETQEQLDFFLDLDCDYIQGFFFNKPMTAAEFEQLLGRQ